MSPLIIDRYGRDGFRVQVSIVTAIGEAVSLFIAIISKTGKGKGG
jgi:hypothetical protein